MSFPTIKKLPITPELKQIKVDVVKRQQYEKAAELRDKEKKLLGKLEAEKKKFEEQMQKDKQKISVEDVYDAVYHID